MPHRNVAARVAILMCTKNGAAFIDEQLKSIAEQTHENWILIVSDDGSEDGTVGKLKEFSESHPHKVIIRSGPDSGVCANFLSLANDPTIDADYLAFSDQDDIWHRDKLQRALSWLAAVPRQTPGMYCGRTELMTIDGKSYGFSPLFTGTPAFQNALVQSLAGGNTMVFNRAAKKILEEAGTTSRGTARLVVISIGVSSWWRRALRSATDAQISSTSQQRDWIELGLARSAGADLYDVQRTFSELEYAECYRAAPIACAFGGTEKSRNSCALCKGAVRVSCRSACIILANLVSIARLCPGICHCSRLPYFEEFKTVFWPVTIEAMGEKG